MAAVRLPGDAAVWWQRLPVPTGRGKRGTGHQMVSAVAHYPLFRVLHGLDEYSPPLDSPDLPLAVASEMLG